VGRIIGWFVAVVIILAVLQSCAQSLIPTQNQTGQADPAWVVVVLVVVGVCSMAYRRLGIEGLMVALALSLFAIALIVASPCISFPLIIVAAILTIAAGQQRRVR
jgi:hypothetical protein